MCDEPHHWNKKQTLSEWLHKEGIPGIEGIDTRQLTKILREKGTMRGKIVIEGDEEKNVDFVDPSKFNLVKEVSVKVGDEELVINTTASKYLSSPESVSIEILPFRPKVTYWMWSGRHGF